MAASRASSLRALNQLAAGSRQVRRLHITGSATYSSLLTSERPAINVPRDLAGLRVECHKRHLPTTGTKAELMERLSAHELVNTHSFSTAMNSESKRPSASAPTSPLPVRHFNTSRTLKTVNDSSTIDFAFLPDFNPETEAAPNLRVPLLPSTVLSSASALNPYAVEAEDTVMRPEIITVSADSTHISAPSAMSEVSDNTAIDFQGMAEKVSAAAARFKAGSIDETAGMAKQVWSGFLDDLLGPKHGAKA